MRHTIYLHAMFVAMLALVTAFLTVDRIDRWDLGMGHTGQRVDVNRADDATLCLLPAIGPQMATRIVVDRVHEGPYNHVNDLMRIAGVGALTVGRLRPYVVCGEEGPQ